MPELPVQQHALQLEEDLKKVCTEQDSTKKEIAELKASLSMQIENMGAALNNYRVGMQFVTGRIFGKLH